MTAFYYCTPDVKQMASRSPDRPDGQSHECAMAFEVDDFGRFGLLVGEAQGKTSAIHDTLFDNSNKAQGPETKENVEIAKVSETDNRRQDAQVDGRKVAGEVDLLAQIARINGDAGQASGKVPEDIPGKDTKNGEESRPEDFIAKDARYTARLVKTRGEFESKLGKRESEAFVVFPLTLEDNAKAQACAKDCY